MVEYETGVAANEAPDVQAGDDQTTTVSVGVSLDAIVEDDGLPGAALTFSWEKTAGPEDGDVIASPMTEDTAISFTLPGVYTYQLTVNDGELDGSDSVVITVNPDPVVNNPPDADAREDLTTTLSAGVSIDAEVTDDGLLNPTPTY